MFAIDGQLVSRRSRCPAASSTSLTPGSARTLLGNFWRGRVSRLQIRAADLDIDRRRQSQIQNGIHQPAGLKISVSSGSSLRNAAAPAPCIHSCRSCALLQAHLHERGVGAGIARVDRGEAGRHADIRGNQSQICGDYLAHDVFDLFHFSLGRFEPRAGRRFQVNDKLPGSVRGK